MKAINTDWTELELKAYILLYCANANYTESEEERDLIISKVGRKKFSEIHKEIEKDNDYQSIQKILSTIDRFNYSDEQKEELLAEIKELFFSDGDFDLLEQNLYMNLRHILN